VSLTETGGCYNRSLVDVIISIAIFLLGLAFGSFLNVCIYRIPRALPDEPEASAFGEMLSSIAAWRSVAQPSRSFCPNCGNQIRAYDNIPVLSWLLLRGRCRDCGKPISIRYASVELLTALLFLACYLQFGWSLETLKFCIFVLLLVPLVFTDAEHKLLPDAYTIPGLGIGLLFSLFVPVNDFATQLLPAVIAKEPSWQVLSLADAVLGALIGAGFIYGAGLLYRIARGQEGMGLGDVKLMAMVGAFLGLRLTVLTIFGGSVLGCVFALLLVTVLWQRRTRRRMRRNHETAAVARRRAWKSVSLIRYYAIPFGVFLGSMALIATFLGDAFFHWYWRLYL
jgi:leader peptidase (prepilin peptidase)/N-methyltransferase